MAYDGPGELDLFVQSYATKDLSPNIIRRAQGAVADPHFGPIMADNLATANHLLREGTPGLNLDVLPAAVGNLATLLISTSVYYVNSSRAPASDSETWQKHLKNVGDGKIELLPKENWMLTDDALDQVERADRLFRNARRGVQALLAAINYERFTDETMADAKRILATSPEGAAESQGLEAMPHLTVSNWAIAQINRHIYNRMSEQPRGELHIIEPGPGTGATSAAVTKTLAMAEGHLGRNRLSMLGIEATPSFSENLRKNFFPLVNGYLHLLGLDIPEMKVATEEGQQVEPGTFRIVQGDLVDEILKLDFSELGPEDVVVFNANYVMHRIPSNHKKWIWDKLATAPNCIILMGDLDKNASDFNLGYYNESTNGPLNTGNNGQTRSLEEAGFNVARLGSYRSIDRYVHPALVNRARLLVVKDGTTRIAFRGQKAHQHLLVDNIAS
ncbi:MAG TPA: hypothetical protein VLG27_04100 [Candidatus Saccharimonadia bacterium]|nr:hypothetical protein [Candidatus Saccharimonadia bacterium]